MREIERAIEGLERRQLLAGNVAAAVVDGVLLIRGDAAANDLILDADPGLPGSILVRSEGDTTINGEGGLFEATGVTKAVRVDLGRGDDRLDLRGLAAPGDLRIFADDGDDLVTIQDAEVAGRLAVDLGKGDDALDVLSSTIHGRTRIHAGDGDDLLTADASTFSGHFRLDAGAGDDTIFLGSSAFPAGKAIHGGAGRDRRDAAPVELAYRFERSRNGWRAALADYFTGRLAEFEFQHGIAEVPGDVVDGRGFLLSGNNLTDDLFMYLTRQVGRGDGLVPNAEYQVRFDITFASKEQTGCAGVGGSPGDSVFLKAGTSAARPRTTPDSEGVERLNLDHGQQASSGTDISTVGPIHNGDACDLDNPSPYRDVRRRHVHPTTVRTDAQGNLHLVVGTDSGFEATTAIYVRRIAVTLVPVG